MTRRQIREEKFKALFQYDFYDGDDGEERVRQLRLFVASDMDFPGDASERDAIADEVGQIAEQVGALDARIDAASDSWPTRRMNKVDLALLRLATYEMTVDKLDPGIAINEAVELAKQYGTDESGRFVNGVLGQIVRQL